jgi:hypothetical protein
MIVPITFCKADPEKLALADALQSQWPDPTLTWTILDELPHVNYDDFKAAADWGLKGWSSVSKLRPVFTDKAGEARLKIYTRKLDGPQGVLADCELPNPGVQSVTMRIDLSEDWDAGITSPITRQIKLADVIRHEGGHGIGIGHAPQGSKNWMAPIYDAVMLMSPAGIWDTNQAVSRYGQAIATPPPVTPTIPTIPPTTGGTFVLGTFMKLLPVLQWFIANKDQLALLLQALKAIFDAFQSAQATKPAALTAEPLIDKAAYRALVMQWATTLQATAAQTPWPWDDAMAAVLLQAVQTDWLMDMLYAVAVGQLHISESLLQAAMTGDHEAVKAHLSV